MTRSGLFVASLLLLASVASANQHDESVEVAQDPAGDVQLFGMLPGSTSDSLDLTELLLGGNDTHFHATIGVVDLDGSTAPKDPGDYLFHYNYGGNAYRLHIMRSNPLPDQGVRYASFIEAYNEKTHAYEATDYQATISPRETEDQFDIGIPFGSIIGRGNLPASPGYAIGGIYVRAFAAHDDADPYPDPLTSVQVNSTYDRMPNQETVSWTIQQRSFAGSQVLVNVANNQRLTNGLSTAFAFSFSVSNAGEAPAEFTFQLQDAPNGWEASVVDEFLEVAAHSTSNNTAILRTSDSHAHGAVATVKLVTTQLSSGETWSNDLVIAFTDTPQPAGHHNTLHLHASTGPSLLGNATEAYGTYQTDPFMNTLDEDPDDTGKPLNAELDGDRVWHFPLAPSLGIGLDFVLEGEGVLQFDVKSRDALTVPKAKTWAQLRLQDPIEQDILLAESQPIDLGDVVESTPVDLRLVPTTESDFVEYREGRNLVLDVWYAFDEPIPGTRAEELVLLPGGFLQLPLREYHDPVPLVANTGVLLEAPRVITGRPGTTIAIQVNVTNQLPNSNDVTLEARGHAAEWNPQFRPTTLHLASAEGKTTVLGVQIPANAQSGDVLRFLVVGRDSSQAASAVAPVTIIVDENSQTELFESQPGKQSPGPGFSAIVLASLAIAALTRARSKP